MKNDTRTTSAPPLQTIREKLLRRREFAGCAFAAEPRLFSYKLQRQLELAAVLLNPLNAPVLVITDAVKPARALFKDYPGLRFIIALNAGKTALVHTRDTALPLDLFLEENIPKETVRRPELWMIAAALAAVCVIGLIIYFCVR
jgi:hypothetical protein